MAKSIYQVADYFEKKLLKLASAVTTETVTPIIERVVASAKSENKQLLGPVNRVDAVNVQGGIATQAAVQFQLVIEPSKYEQLASEPTRTDVVNFLTPRVEQALNAAFPNQAQFGFRIRIAITPLM